MSKRKTYAEIYGIVDFIKNNHSKLFPTEIMQRVDISYSMLKKVAADLNLELLDITKADNVLSRAPKPKRKYTRRKKKQSAIQWFKNLFNH